MRFLTFLNEFSFKSAKDVDYPTKVRRVVVFEKDETYIVRGNAHDLRSHAIKHLDQFDTIFMSSIVNNAINIISDSDYWVRKNTGEEFRGSLDNYTVVNTFDLINDKIHFGDKLLIPEEKIKPLIDKIANRYEKIIKEYISKSKYISDDMEISDVETLVINKNTIKFKVHESGADMFHYIDLSNYAFMVEYKGNIKTLYKLDSVIKGNDTLGKRYRRKKAYIYNNSLRKILGVE